MSTHPTAAEIAAGLSMASHAPSVHNTQPWQWRSTPTGLELFADRTRRLQNTDPHGRLLLMSCGAALHHLQVAMAAAGWKPHIQRFPDQLNPSHLASSTFEAVRPDEQVRAWASAITARRSDRRPMSSWRVPDAHITRLAQLAAEHGVIAGPLSAEEILRWSDLAMTAERRRLVPEYRHELYEWTHRREASRDGIPARNRVSVDEAPTPQPNRLPPGDIPPVLSGEEESGAVPLLLTTSSDDPMARLRAGEGLSAVLLEATRLGLATAIDSQALELARTREEVEDEMLVGTRSPQVLVVVGWPSSADPLPQTPRREIDAILQATHPEDVLLTEHP